MTETAPDFPTADEVAKAIVLAARLHGEDPEAIFETGTTSRARHVAMEALRIAYPKAKRAPLALCLGYRTTAEGKAPLAMINMARKTKWWREEYVDEIVGTLVASRYGEQSA